MHLADFNDQNFCRCHHFPCYFLKSAELYRKNNLFFDRTSIFKYHAGNLSVINQEHSTCNIYSPKPNKINNSAFPPKWQTATA
ncbi:hypothetical protein CF65_00989 [Aggregatibacter actinomycetemcomitans HK1651]|nr:hypothetical protein CF65_00989 [Aggregatibacter actinomycetemcomitans HK1651]